ncbi:MAG TPA: cystathionine gamma-lyase [Mycobacteriales bacterium]|nr:cystathionine gamma-lyase [Mycobacteriales bacterium]
MSEPGDGTRSVRAGLPTPVVGAPLLPGPVFAAPFHLAGEPAPAGEPPIGYGRPDNPTWRHLERALAELDGATETVVFASGMAAVAAVLFTVLRAGATVVIPSDGYYAVRPLAAVRLVAFGVEVRQAPTVGPYELAGAALVLVETPSNPSLDVCDLAALVATAHATGALVAVDNTTATPLGQRPLDLGADVVVASDTKALAGHSDLLLGHVSVRDPDLAARIRSWRTHAGAIPGPFEAWLAHRSLGTLDLRLARQAANALALAELLRGRPEVTGLRYPGLPTDPAYPLAVRQMRRFGGVLSCVLPDAAHADAMVAASTLLTAATSFGGLHTTVDRRGRWGGDDVPDGFVRISAGCEDTADLVADCARALDRARR